jgi:hypothetical protein
VVRKAARTLEQICEEGIEVVDLSDGGRRYSLETLDADPTQFIVMTLHFMRANQESVIKGARVRDARERGRKEARANGRLFTSNLPFWLSAPAAGKTTIADITVIEDRAAVVRHIYEAFVAGEGVHTITKDLTRRKVPAWGRSGHWARSYIQHILRTKAVLGTYTPQQQETVGGLRKYKTEAPIQNYLPRIISDELWAAAQARLTEVQPRGKATERPIKNMLQGLCRCTVCNGTMSKVRAKFLVCGEAQSRQKHKPAPIVYLDVVKAVLTQLPALVAETPRLNGAELARQIEGTRAALHAAESDQQDIVNEIVQASAAERVVLRRKLAEVVQEAKGLEDALSKLLAKAQATDAGDVVARLEALVEALKPSRALLSGDDAVTEIANKALKRCLSHFEFDAKHGLMTPYFRHLPDVASPDIRFPTRWMFRDDAP